MHDLVSVYDKGYNLRGALPHPRLKGQERMIFRSGLLLCVLLTAYSVLVVTSTAAFSGGPDLGHTGGFDEPTCQTSGCHADFELNSGRAKGLGDLVLEGLPEQYEPGKTYPVTLTITHVDGRQYWGFQAASRVKATGAQAGQLKATDQDTQVLEAKGVQYIEHTLLGIPTNTFTFDWVAPGSPAGDVIVHVAGNAADGSGEASGDYIYTTSVTLSPSH
jgi:hypothetical protein